MKETILILSCEHASANIPMPWQNILHGHDSYDLFAYFDPYAKELCEQIAKQLDCELLLGNISRMILDLNKEHHQQQCFPKPMRERLNEEDKNSLINDYVHPYQRAIKKMIANHLSQNQQVLHLSVHTFNPIEKGMQHNAALGLLYDSRRHGEKEVVRIFHELLMKRTPYKIRLNYPRTGRKENLTSVLRKYLCESDYLGIELECNAFLLDSPDKAQEFYAHLIGVLHSLLELL